MLCPGYIWWLSAAVKPQFCQSVLNSLESIPKWGVCFMCMVNTFLCSKHKLWRKFPGCSHDFSTLFHLSAMKGIIKNQFSSVAQLCPTLCDPMDCSMPGFPVHHQLQELAQIHVHQVADAIQPSHPLSSPSPPAFNLAPHQGLFQWVN